MIQLHLSEFSSLHSSLFFFYVTKIEFVFIFKYCKDTYFNMLWSALHTSGSQALAHRIQSKATSTHTRNFANKQRQIPSTVSSIQFRLLSIYILGIYVLGHKNLLGKISLYNAINSRNEMMRNGPGIEFGGRMVVFELK